MKITGFTTEKGKHCIKVRAEISDCVKPGTLWFELPLSYEDWIEPDRYDAFAVALFSQAMCEKRPLLIDGKVSALLARNLYYYSQIYSKWFPQFEVINLTSDYSYEKQYNHQDKKIAAGFSCGVDSLCTVQEWTQGKLSDFEKLTNLININVGSHGHGNSGNKLFQKRLRLVQKAADELELPLITVNSNLDSFYTARFEDSYASRIIGVALLLGRRLSQYVLASTNTYWQLGPEGSSPLSDFLLGNEQVEVVVDGAHLSRIEKIKRIMNWKFAQRHLNVCTRNTARAENCSECIKCARTMLIIDMLKTSTHFQNVFDFKNFDSTKKIFVEKMKMLGAKPPHYYWMEIIEYASKIGYKLD